MGLGSTVPREEKLRLTFAYLFGGLAIASVGGGFYFFSETQMEFLSQFLLSFLLMFLITFPLGLRYRGRKYRLGAALLDMHTPTESEIRHLMRRIPKIEATIEGRGNVIFGFKVVVKFTIQNTTNDTLDNLDAKLTVRDLHLKRKEKFLRKDLSDIFPKEKASYMIEARLGRRFYPVNVVLKIRRRRVVLEEIHWTCKDQNLE